MALCVSFHAYSYASYLILRLRFFSVLEMQVFLVDIFRNFEVSLAVPAERIRREAAGVMVPTIDGEVDKGSQLPVRIRIAA